MRKTLIAGMAAIFLAGCATEYSEVPRPTNYSVLKQKKIQAAAHWDVIANDVAEQLKNSLSKDEILYISKPKQETGFAVAFYNQLLSALVNKGIRVSKNGDTRALVIDVETQLVKFAPDRFQNHRFVSTTAIAAGVMAVNGLHLSGNSNAAIGVLGVTAARDWHEWVEREYANGNTPQYELIVTTSATNNVQYIARRTDVYYIADPDNRLYHQNQTLKSMAVTGGL
jgi:uncharacterized lipoprotein YajG